MMKQKIIEQSIQLFESKGFSETSIQDIVDALGVTKGTFYYYFSSKEQLLMDIHSNYINELLEKQMEIMNGFGDYQAKVINVIQLLITDIKRHGRKAKIFYREWMNLNEENQRVIKEQRKEFRLNLKELIEKGMENGEFDRGLKPDMICFAILGMCNWSYNWFNPKGSVSDQELAEIYANTLFKGISVNNEKS